MASAPPRAALSASSSSEPQGFWNRFWFKPADPTILGFMRIAVGLLVVYTHLIYSFDLHEFFGKDGWYHLDIMNKRRHEQPWIFPADDFASDKVRVDPYKPYEYANANKSLTDFEPQDQLDQLLRVSPVLSWKSPNERAQIEGITSDKDRIKHLTLL
jgi:hypothetical protein